MPKRKQPVVVKLRDKTVPLDKLLSVLNAHLHRAIKEKLFVSFSEWTCQKCADKKPRRPHRVMLTISDSDKPIVISTHSHCRECGEPYPTGSGA